MIIKVCGITTLDDARVALEAGVDWLGLNFVAGPRRLEWPTAEAIVAGLDDTAGLVALISQSAGDDRDETPRRLADWGVRRLQVYVRSSGDPAEASACLRRLHADGFETIAVQPIADEASFVQMETTLASCRNQLPGYVLLDTADSRRLGGTGRTADWGLIAEVRNRGLLDGWPPVLLAGGLSPANVGEAIRAVGPTGVDVCSGVESSPGRKDAAKIAALVTAVRAV